MSGTPATTRVLVISPRADDRVETRALIDVVRELRRRSETTVALWWLRGERGPADRVVDELRTSGGLALLDRVPVRALANGIRGRVLRRWLRAADPDWVVLDGGLGERAVAHSAAHRVIRLTTTPSADADAEAAPFADADLWLLPPGGEPPLQASAHNSLEFDPDLAERRDAVPFRSSSARSTVRRRLGLGTEGRLVVGWSGDGRGAEQFASTLRELRSQHGISVSGLWLGDEPPAPSDADACAEADRVHHRPTRPLDVRLCGDTVVLIGAAPVDVTEVHDALVAGLPVLTTAPARTGFDRAVRVVADGPDARDGATALARELAAVLHDVDDTTTTLAGAQAAERLDLRTWVQSFVSALHRTTGSRTTGSAG